MCTLCVCLRVCVCVRVRVCSMGLNEPFVMHLLGNIYFHLCKKMHLNMENHRQRKKRCLNNTHTYIDISASVKSTNDSSKGQRGLILRRRRLWSSRIFCLSEPQEKTVALGGQHKHWVLLDSRNSHIHINTVPLRPLSIVWPQPQ